MVAGVVGVASGGNCHSDGETCVEFFGVYVLFVGKPFDCLSEAVGAGKGDQGVGASARAVCRRSGRLVGGSSPRSAVLAPAIHTRWRGPQPCSSAPIQSPKPPPRGRCCCIGGLTAGAGVPGSFATRMRHSPTR